MGLLVGCWVEWQLLACRREAGPRSSPSPIRLLLASSCPHILMSSHPHVLITPHPSTPARSIEALLALLHDVTLHNSVMDSSELGAAFGPLLLRPVPPAVASGGGEAA